MNTIKIAGGKSREGSSRVPAVQGNIEGEILFIHRGGKNNENEIGENIAVIRQESRHGIHSRRTSDKQEFTEAVS